MRRVAVVQSNYLPWKGYFHIIHEADLFIFYDDVQYTKHDWRNRNLVKTPQGLRWITVPVGSDISRRINEVGIRGQHWQARHLKTLRQYYGRCPFFGYVEGFLDEVYLQREWRMLSELNTYLIERISREFLGIGTEFARSESFAPEGQGLDRLMDLLVKCGAGHYISGPSARAYIDEAAFRRLGIGLSYMDYSQYPAYQQPYPPFVHGVSIVDLLCSVGPGAPGHIWGGENTRRGF